MLRRLTLLALIATGAFGQPFINYRGVANAASYVPSGLPHGQLARGSIFSLFGRAMGPATGVQVSESPLANTLSGVSIEVCQNSSCIPAIPIYVRADQINAIIPSNAPLGPVSLRVTYNGQAGNFTPATVVAASPGIFAMNAGGFGPGIIQNFNSGADQPVNSAAVPARPGQVLVLWATGLGAGLNADNVTPRVGDLPVALEIWVGGRAVTNIRYKGRSGCCSGLDQIIFDLPPDAPTGCYVPVFLRANGALVSNAATMAISADGSACSDAFNPISERFRQGGRLGYVTGARVNMLENFIETEPEFTAETATATFRRATASPFYFDPQISLPPVGSCTVHTMRGDLLGGDELPGFAIAANELNAGTEIRFGTIAVPREENPLLYTGRIASSLEEPGLPASVLNAATTVSGPGGADVGTFQFTMQPPGAITFPGRDQLVVIDRSKALTVNWQASGAGNDVVLITGIGVNLPENSSAQFVCVANPAAGAFSIPPHVLQAMPITPDIADANTAFGYLFVGRSALRAPTTFAAPGADAAFGISAQHAGRAVLFR